MRPSRAILGLSIGLLVVALSVWLLLRPSAKPRTASKKAAPTEIAPRDEAPRRERPRSPRRPALNAPTTPAAVINAPAQPRTERLADVVRDRAIRSNWMTLDDRDTPCPPDRVRIVYDAPADLSTYTRGAYFEPLGPAPDDSTDEINGLLLCEGSNYLYRGFEAYWRADRQDWDVYPFPVVE